MAASPPTLLREAGSRRQTRRRFGRRLSATHVLIALAVILAFVLNLLVLNDRNATTLVAVADRPLPAGTTLDAGDVRLVPVDSSFEGLDGLLTETEIGDMEGWVLARTLGEGSLVDSTALMAPETATGMRTMSLPVSVEHAVGGAVVPGDRVDVISVDDGVASYVAADLVVVSVAEPSGGGIGGTGGFHIVVSVDADQALRLAEAMESGSVEVLRSTGAAPVETGGTRDDG